MRYVATVGVPGGKQRQRRMPEGSGTPFLVCLRDLDSIHSNEPGETDKSNHPK
jgi:hypothetical protein